MRRVVATTLSALLCTVACGVSTDDQATPIDMSGEPALLATSTTTSIPDSTGVQTLVYFLQTDEARLVASTRQVAPERTIRTAIEALLAGTTEEESDDDIRTQIPDDTELLGANEVGDVLVLNFNEAFLEGEATSQNQAFAQIVYTVSDIEPGAKVEFRVLGEPKPVLIDNGESVQRCVTRDDFARLGPDFDPGDPPAEVTPPDCPIQTEAS